MKRPGRGGGSRFEGPATVFHFPFRCICAVWLSPIERDSHAKRKEEEELLPVPWLPPPLSKNVLEA